MQKTATFSLNCFVLDFGPPLGVFNSLIDAFYKNSKFVKS